MADYYTQGSTVYCFKDEDQKKVMQDLLETIYIRFDKDCDEGDFEEGCWVVCEQDDDNDDVLETYRFKENQLHHFHPNTDDYEFTDLGFDYQFQDNSIWIYEEEHINLEMVGDLFQEFFKKCDIHGSFSMTSADTCSKPREDSFGGGAMFVTAHSMEFFSTYDWCEQKRSEHRKKLEDTND
jgi:hypothetical protein